MQDFDDATKVRPDGDTLLTNEVCQRLRDSLRPGLLEHISELTANADLNAQRCRNRLSTALAGSAAALTKETEEAGWLWNDEPLGEYRDGLARAVNDLQLELTEVSHSDDCPPALDTRSEIGRVCSALHQMGSALRRDDLSVALSRADDIVRYIGAIGALLAQLSGAPSLKEQESVSAHLRNDSPGPASRETEVKILVYARATGRKTHDAHVIVDGQMTIWELRERQLDDLRKLGAGQLALAVSDAHRKEMERLIARLQEVGVAARLEARGGTYLVSLLDRTLRVQQVSGELDRVRGRKALLRDAERERRGQTDI